MDNTNLRDFILQSGLVLGVTLGILILAAYFMGVETMVSWWVSLLNIGLVIGCPVYFAVNWKKRCGGYIEFKNAFLIIFLIFSIGTFLSTLFNITLYTVIDPGLPEAIFNAAIEKSTAMMQRFGAPDDKIDEVIEKMQNNKGDFSAASMMKGYFGYLMAGIIIALIGAGIIKKNKSVF